MPAAKLVSNLSLLEVREEIAFSSLALRADPHAADLAHYFDALLTDWSALLLAQLARWDAQLAADLRVGRVDDALGVHIDAFVRALLDAVGNDRDHARFVHYFAGARPSDVKRPVLGPELELVRSWLDSLAGEDLPALRRFHDVFAADVTAADAATAASAHADEDNRRFRQIGELAKYLDRVQAVRDEVYAALDGRRTEFPERGLPRDYASSFFRRRRSPTLTEDERRAQAERKAAARQAAADAAAKRREAAEKLREARRALAALKRPT